MKKNENQEPAEQEKKDRTGPYLWITLSGFVFLWLAAMRYLALFDAVILLMLVFCASIGTIRGGIKEFFSFFGVLASFIVAVNGYLVFHDLTQFNFGTNDTSWGRLCWFLLLLGSGWIACRLLSYYFEKTVAKIALLQYLNQVLGGTLGGLKGVILGYVLAISLMHSGATVYSPPLKPQLLSSYSYRGASTLEERYRFLEKLEKMDLSTKIERYMERHFKEKKGD